MTPSLAFFGHRLHRRSGHALGSQGFRVAAHGCGSQPSGRRAGRLFSARHRHSCSPAPRPFAASACPHQNICTASPSHGLSFTAARHTRLVTEKGAHRQAERHNGPAQQFPLRRFGQAGPQALFQRGDGLAHEHHRVGQPCRVAEMASSTKPPSTAQAVIIRRPPRLSCTARSSRGGAGASRPSRRRPAHSRPRWGRTTHNNRAWAGRTAPWPPSGCRRGPG